MNVLSVCIVIVIVIVIILGIDSFTTSKLCCLVVSNHSATKSSRYER